MSIKFKNKDEIAEKLKDCAKLSAAEIGMKKTSVDSLVKAVGISKGAFYNFFNSKDEMFLEIVEDWHTHIYSGILETLTAKNELSNKTKLAKAIYNASEFMSDESIIEFYDRDLPLLLNNIAGSDLLEQYHDDDVHIHEVIKFSNIRLLVTDDEAVDIIRLLVSTVKHNVSSTYWHSHKIMINAVSDFIVK